MMEGGDAHGAGTHGTSAQGADMHGTDAYGAVSDISCTQDDRRRQPGI